MNGLILPEQIKRHLLNMKCEQNKTGCSQADVYRYQSAEDVLYLKIARADGEIRRERDLLLWLNGKLPVPEVKHWCEQDGTAYLLMTEVPGQMSCVCPEDSVLEPVENTVKLLADGLLMLQSVDTADCPFDCTLDKKLARALFNIENDLVDMADWEEKNEFAAPAELHSWLTLNKPEEDICFTHGDYCMPNIFIGNNKITGFIDTGRGGLADKWQDIALCVRSLRYNLRNTVKPETDSCISLLFLHLGLKPDWEKINYYILLDELF